MASLRCHILLGLICFLVEDCVSFDASYRLSNDHIPKSYDLEILINPLTYGFNGTVTIHFTTKTHTNTIRLHAPPMFITLTNIIVNDKMACNVSHPSTALEATTEIVTITCKNNLDANKENKIKISYDGVYHPNIRYIPFNGMGLAHIGYQINGKGGHRFVGSQFEPIFARRAVPCFDEPQFKAEFNVTIVHPQSYMALSNTPAYSEKLANRFKTTKFAKTPVMSPHLLSIIVGQLQITKETTPTLEVVKKVKNIYALPDKLNHLGTLRTYGDVLLSAMENWTAIAYETLGNKNLEFIVLPLQYPDSQPGWGLVSFHEFDVLDDESSTTIEKRQIIISNIAYHLSLQWFNNYVTPDWWSNVWMKEAFAGYFQYLIPDEVKSLQMDRQRQFSIEYYQPALYADAPYPFGRPLGNKDEDVYIRDDIVAKLGFANFQKGACLLRMIEDILGEANFKKGLKHYLIENKFKTANPAKLFNTLQKYHNDSTHTIGKVMNEWIYKPGYPLVTVTLQKDGKSVKLHQEEYNNDGKPNSTWYIPVTYTTGVEKKFDVKVKTYLHDKSIDIALTHKTWILVNLQHSGFYRVNYDKELWKRIIEVLKSKDMKEIPVSNRAQLIDDVFTLAKKGIISYNISLDLLEYIKKETEYEPWYTAETWIKETIFVLENLENHKYLENFKKSAHSWIKQAFPNGVNAKTHLQKLTKIVLSDLENVLNKTYKVDSTKITFDEFIAEERNNNEANIKTIVCRGLQMSFQSSSYHKMLMDYFRKSTSNYERKQILSALECLDDPYDLEMFLLDTLSEESTFSNKEVRVVYESVYKNIKFGVDVYLRFLKEHLNEIINRHKFLSHSELLLRAADRIMNVEQLIELEEIVEKHQNLENMKLIGQTLIEQKALQLSMQEEQFGNLMSYLA